MSYKLLLVVPFILTTLLVLYLISPCVGQMEDDESEKRNDNVIQFYNNCTCQPWFRCPEAHRYMEDARASLLPKDGYCEDNQFFCCKNELTSEPVTAKPATNAETPITTTTTPTTESSGHKQVDKEGQNCGVAKTKIQLRTLNPDDDSAPTIPGEIPWLVEIFQKRKKIPYMLKCAGTLIHPKVVLTATHCIVSNTPDSLKIIATGREIFQNVGHNLEDERNVVKIIKHPQFYSGGLYNDISLLLLDNPFDFSDNFLNAICLPRANQTFEGKRCVAAGWGPNPDHKDLPLRKVDVPIVGFQQCQNLLRESRLGPDFNLHSSFVCAGGEEGKGACKGDGGGLLTCVGDDYRFVQAGIVSWGVNCSIVDQPGLYVNVGRFVEWIKQELFTNGISIK